MKKLLVLALVVAGLAMGVAGCQKAQTPEQQTPTSEVKSAATPTPAINTGTTTSTTTPASVAVPTTTPSAKTTTGTMTR